MVERSQVDLSHNSLQILEIGRLMGLTRIPVLGGDSFTMNSTFTFRLNQLRRPMTVDMKIDTFAFFCPYRYAYPNWVDYMEMGGEENITFPTAGTEPQYWLCNNTAPYPRHLWNDAARIWNDYFRDPGVSKINGNTPIQDTVTRTRGLKCFHLKSWGTAQSKLAEINDAEYDVDTSGPSINIYRIQERASRARDKSFRDFVSSRYIEIMESMTGADVSDYSDDRPELVWKQSEWMSGYDINATAGAELGATVGKGVGIVNFKMPRRFFAEHGTLYVFALVRMPPLFVNAKQYLDNFNRTFRELVPSPHSDIPPKHLTMGDVFRDGSSESLGVIPAYEWYRDHPSYVHYDFYKHDRGWQYLPTPTTAAATIEPGNYDSMFASKRLAHCVVACDHRIKAWRPIPDPMKSIMVDM